MALGILSKGLTGINESSRSTVLKSLAGLILSLLAGILICAWIGAYEWLIIVLTILLLITFCVFIFTYLFCLFTNPNLLRSEKHTEHMKAMEKGYYFGDNISGVRKYDVIDTSIPKEIQG